MARTPATAQAHFTGERNRPAAALRSRQEEGACAAWGRARSAGALPFLRGKEVRPCGRSAPSGSAGIGKGLADTTRDGAAAAPTHAQCLRAGPGVQ